MEALVDYSDSEGEEEEQRIPFVESHDEDSDDEFLMEDAAEEEAEQAATTRQLPGPRVSVTTAPAERARLFAAMPSVNPFMTPRKKPNNTGEDHPEMAAHERDRKLPQKAPVGPRGRASITRKTEKPKRVTVTERINKLARVCGKCEEEGKMLVKPLKTGGNGEMFCRACKEEVSTNYTTSKTHCTSKKHRDNIMLWNTKANTDEEVKEQLEDYYVQNPNEKYGTVRPEEMLYRYRCVETFMYAGIPLAKTDDCRPLLQRAGFSLTDSASLGVFVPKVEAREIDTTKGELRDEHASVCFDGTRRNGEAVNAVARWCSASFKLEQRLIMFATTAKSMDHKQTVALIRDLWLKTLGMDATKLSWFVRDSVKVNGSSTTKLMQIFDNADDLM
jgi:hypothetical protein